ncbi:MAG TPA: DUF4349 domain-containing protein [Gaiellaceae bacterium]
MPDVSFETVLRELRASAPQAPAQLRERVRGLPEPHVRAFGFKRRPALAAAAAIAIAVALGAAAIQGYKGSPDRRRDSLSAEVRQPRAQAGASRLNRSFKSAFGKSSDRGRFFGPVVPGSRLQQYDVAMSARVDDLSHGTKSAIRTTRRLGGYVAAADYSTGQTTGDSRLDLRVPVPHVQQAIASLTELGTILSQRISVADLQRTVDRIDQRRLEARMLVAELAAKQRRAGLTPAEQARLSRAMRTVARLSRSRANLVSEGTYAKISLTLTTRTTAARQTTPGRFDRFWGDAGDILGKEAIIVLYALVVAGPFVLLAALALLAERARRRRADSRLLEETA